MDTISFRSQKKDLPSPTTIALLCDFVDGFQHTFLQAAGRKNLGRIGKYLIICRKQLDEK
jgi:hypothetical protein